MISSVGLILLTATTGLAQSSSSPKNLPKPPIFELITGLSIPAVGLFVFFVPSRAVRRLQQDALTCSQANTKAYQKNNRLLQTLLSLQQTEKALLIQHSTKSPSSSQAKLTFTAQEFTPERLEYIQPSNPKQFRQKKRETAQENTQLWQDNAQQLQLLLELKKKHLQSLKEYSI
ncbi:hypothetical protein PN462_15970 [Spirulina sp. CS-785/01]|uniref:hypothetical protein n=1 Tax=Spirulina sp. CS-785/01 TaxID=3021716 RepID=UPI00232D9177|nr:hypothetical protein [Spirulina sp. CS-785/01]MDB9314609.1 hypothetical protein [Spirulina sp. CS-785/01]